MKSRMEKYSNFETGNRTDRNRNLYKELNKADLSITRTYSNSRVIDEANKEIDIEKIKRYIEKMNDNGTVSSYSYSLTKDDAWNKGNIRLLL